MCARIALEIRHASSPAKTRALMLRFREVKVMGPVQFHFHLDKGSLLNFSDILKEYPSADVSPAALKVQMCRMPSNMQATAVATEKKLEDGRLIGHSMMLFELILQPLRKYADWPQTLREVLRRPHLKSLEKQISVWL